MKTDFYKLAAMADALATPCKARNELKSSFLGTKVENENLSALWESSVKCLEDLATCQAIAVNALLVEAQGDTPPEHN